VRSVPEFLSPEWIAALDAAAAPLVVPEGVGDLTIEQVVRRAPGDEVRYQVVFAAGRVRVVPGDGAEPDVRVITDAGTAAAIHRGELSAQAALAAGRAKLQGPIQHLRGREAVLRGLDDAFASVRAATTFP
jgi:hypothetical protein